MNIFLPCHCTGDFTDFIGIVQLDKSDIHKVQLRNNAFVDACACSPDLYEMSYWDGSVEWYEVDSGLHKNDYSKLLSAITNNQSKILPSRFRMSKHSTQARVECERMVVNERGFYWKCYPKHTDQRVTTDYVEWGMLSVVHGVS